MNQDENILSPLADDRPTGDNLRLASGDLTFHRINELMEEGESVMDEISKNLALFQQETEEARLQTLYDDTDDPSNAILTIHPGAGGRPGRDRPRLRRRSLPGQGGTVRWRHSRWR